MLKRVSTIALLMAALAACSTDETASSPWRGIALLNGTDLTGWSGEISRTAENADGQKTLQDFWTVTEDGELHCAGGPGHWSWLHTVEDYTDFELRLQWRWSEVDPEIRASSNNIYNSGILLRANPMDPRPLPHIAMPAAYQAQIAHAASDTGDLWIMGYDHPDFRGDRPKERRVSVPESMLSGKSAPSAKARARMKAQSGWTRAYAKSEFVEQPIGAWNSYAITFDDGRIELRVNGRLVNVGVGAKSIPGKIGIECENTAITFRNIRVIRLD